MLVPVKSFRDAKHRLAPRLSPTERAGLARKMATNVVHACGDTPVFIVENDDEVRAWAHSLDARTVADPGGGLNAAIEAGRISLHKAGFHRIVIAHADLPLATSFAGIDDYDGITLVPDRHGDGTNVMSFDPAIAFPFSYGRHSFVRHLASARAIGLSVRIIHDRNLSADVDFPDDLNFADLNFADLNFGDSELTNTELAVTELTNIDSNADSKRASGRATFKTL